MLTPPSTLTPRLLFFVYFHVKICSCLHISVGFRKLRSDLTSQIRANGFIVANPQLFSPPPRTVNVKKSFSIVVRRRRRCFWASNRNENGKIYLNKWNFSALRLPLALLLSAHALVDAENRFFLSITCQTRETRNWLGLILIQFFVLFMVLVKRFFCFRRAEGLCIRFCSLFRFNAPRFTINIDCLAPRLIDELCELLRDEVTRSMRLPQKPKAIWSNQFSYNSRLTTPSFEKKNPLCRRTSSE